MTFEEELKAVEKSIAESKERLELLKEEARGEKANLDALIRQLCQLAKNGKTDN